MRDDIKTKCEKSFYQELYHFDELQQGLLYDKISGRILLKKRLETYDKEVYRWLKDHHDRHIPAVHSFWEEEGRLIVLEEYIQGDTLSDAINKGNLSDTEKKRIIIGVCDALIFLHSAPSPIIHRDIKASNIMISTDGVVKLVDYDAAKTYHKGKKVDTTLIGTVGAAAPEQFGFAQSDVRTDIYSLGVLIRELFPRDPRYSKIIAKATQMEPNLRYQSVQEMKAVINGAGHAKKSRNDDIGTSNINRVALFFVAIACLLAVPIAIIMSGQGSGSIPASQINNENIDDTEASNSDRPILDQESYDQEKAPSVENIDDGGNESDSKVQIEDDNTIKTISITNTRNSSDSNEKEGIVVSESAWYLNENSGGTDSYIHYCVVLSNPQDGNTVELPAVNITARDSDGNVLGTDRMVGFCIMPGDRIALCSILSISNDYNGDIGVEFVPEKPSYILANGGAHPRNTDFKVKGVSYKASDLFPAVMGELRSEYPKTLDSIAVTALLRKKGKLVAGNTTYIDNIEPNEARAFKIDLSKDKPDHDKIEISVQEW